ncbi:MAG: amino acid ABC transporter substrate-binding protein [Deltaproteobacteria bacterium]|nr:amino acid ABC transporter substrate-binding protein [Deltaproteobacteria bacterium]
MRSLLATILLVTFFAGPLSAKEFTGTLQQIQKTGEIKIGYRQSQPPMSFEDKDGVPIGYSIDICKQIVTELKNTIGSDVAVKYVSVTAEERFKALDFTQLTFVTGASFMALKDTKIRNNFAGKKIGVVKGTTTAVALKKLLEDAQIDAEVVLLKSSADGVKALEKGEIDALSADQIVLIGLAITTKNPKIFSILPDLFSYEPFALAVRRNDADFRLVADRVISDLYRSKKILNIYDKWVGKFSKNRPSAFEALVELNAIPE